MFACYGVETGFDLRIKVRSCLPVQLYPSPVYPCLHMQLNDPWVLLHTAKWLQLCVADAHSLTSAK